MEQYVYKVRHLKTDRIGLVLYCNDKYHELIESIEVPPGTEPWDYLEELKYEVDLGESCEQSRNY